MCLIWILYLYVSPETLFRRWWQRKLIGIRLYSFNHWDYEYVCRRSISNQWGLASFDLLNNRILPENRALQKIFLSGYFHSKNKKVTALLGFSNIRNVYILTFSRRYIPVMNHQKDVQCDKQFAPMEVKIYMPKKYQDKDSLREQSILVVPSNRSCENNSSLSSALDQLSQCYHKLAKLKKVVKCTHTL